jgi:hypothetical protein
MDYIVNTEEEAMNTLKAKRYYNISSRKIEFSTENPSIEIDVSCIFQEKAFLVLAHPQRALYGLNPFSLFSILHLQFPAPRSNPTTIPGILHSAASIASP